MESEYVEISAKAISLEELVIPKAKDFLRTISQLNFVSLNKLLQRDENKVEIIVIDVEVELGQRRKNDIKKNERLAVEFHATDTQFPEVLALRKTFPYVPHLNIKDEEIPRSLCLYDQSYEIERITWTSAKFIERIRDWLALTAKGKLHQPDQPLEPYLHPTICDLILPFSKKDITIDANFLELDGYYEMEGKFYSIVLRKADPKKTKKELLFVATVVETNPLAHGVIRKNPNNIEELSELLSYGDYSFIESLRERIDSWQCEKKPILQSKLIIILRLPKVRELNGSIESYEYRAFYTEDSLKKVGENIGLWDIHEGKVGKLLAVDENKKGNNLKINPLNPVFKLSRDEAGSLSDLDSSITPKIVAVGLGAIGSQVFMNLSKMGYGEWTLIDEDKLLPHNLVRHSLTGPWIGRPKVEAMTFEANSLFQDELVSKCFPDNLSKIFQSDEQKLQACEIFSSSDLILDMTASVAASRFIAHEIDSDARRISIFVNPTGRDLVILSEGKERKQSLDSLEMQYYREIVSNNNLKEHLKLPKNHHRYANSCRDVSFVLSQDSVALHSAIASKYLKSVPKQDDSSASIWKTNLDDFTVSKIDIPIYEQRVFSIGEWTIVTDNYFIEKLEKAREAKLPNETGGVIVGSYDMERKRCYLVDSILSPEDSKEWPTVYIRGSRGLRQKLKSIEESTLGMLEYIGEWHSHPKGCSPAPSSDDRKAFLWLTEVMSTNGHPALMVIVGEIMAFYLGTM